jgi:hypothetical protein
MKAYTSLLVAALLGAPLLGACAPTQAPPAAPTPSAPAAQAATPAAAPAGPAAGAASAQGAGAARSIASVTRASQKHDGLFTLYQDTTNGSVHLALHRDQLDREYIYFLHTVDPPVAAGQFRGQFRNNTVFSVRRNFNKIEFVTENTNFYFDPDNAIARAADANISRAVVAVQDIVAEDAEKGLILIKADDIFLTEALAQIKPSPNPNTRPGASFALGNLSRPKTKFVALRNYPANTDVVVEYVYDNPAPLVGGGREVTDPRYVSVQVQHTLIEMPENDFQPRFDDARVGYFTQQVTDLTSTRSAPFRDLLNRWHLVKQDPTAAISEPVEPIVWWIENTTPHEFRDVIRDATLAWNEAFEAAGFRNAVQVKIQPDDADWDAGDIRYNVLRWTSSPQPPFGGYGPSFVNPRTGQILGADIMLEYVFVTNRVRQDRLFSTAALSLETLEEQLAEGHDPATCSAGHHLQHATLFGLAALRTAGETTIDVNDYIKQSLYYLVLHEVGHTLGLNHNMRAHNMLSPAQLNDRSLTDRVGLTGSVMDYPAVNLAPRGTAQGHFFPAKVGPYDTWAIRFGYDPTVEGAARTALLAESTRPELAFGNDADDMRAPGRGLDPRVNINTLSSDPIGFSTQRFQQVNQAMAGLRDQYAMPGESYHEMRTAYLILTGEYANAANAVSRFVGGVYVDRAVAGQPGATQPFTPVARRDQKRAMDALTQHVFAPNAFAVPADLAPFLAMQRRGFNHGGMPEEPQIHARALNIQRNILNHLLHPRVLTRMVDSRLYGNEYPVVEMMGDLTDAVFAADARGNVNTFRQNLQLEYVGRLATIATGQNTAFDNVAQSAAMQNLRRVERMLAGKSGVNAETQAHTAHVLFQVRKALDTSRG